MFYNMYYTTCKMSGTKASSLLDRKNASINQSIQPAFALPQSPTVLAGREKMEGIQHRTVEVNGIKMHVAEKGEGPVVLFLHGFPELWYSWRHQIPALSSKGYRCVAPDLRGYGDTDVPASISSYTGFHIVGDLVALIDSLGVDQVFLVGHDWGALIGWYFCMFRPERVKAYVCLSVPFLRRNPTVPTVDGMRAMYGDDFYVCRFQVLSLLLILIFR